MLTFISLLVSFIGLIIGLGAVTVIDVHGFKGRKSPYWTEATTRTHKVTKPLIWLGIVLFGVGGAFYYASLTLYGIMTLHLLITFVLILNGLFLSFVVSPFLIKREKVGRSDVLLPQRLQMWIGFSFIFSFLGWWGSVLLIVLVTSFIA